MQQSGYQWGWGMKESGNNAASAWNLFVKLGEDGGHFGHDFLGAPGASVCGSAPRVVAPRACAMPAAVSPWQAVVSIVSPTPDGRSGPAEASAIAPGALSGSAAAAGEAGGSVGADIGGASGSGSRLKGNAFAALASDSEGEEEDECEPVPAVELPVQVQSSAAQATHRECLEPASAGKLLGPSSNPPCELMECFEPVGLGKGGLFEAAHLGGFRGLLDFLTAAEWRQAQQAARHLSGFADAASRPSSCETPPAGPAAHAKPDGEGPSREGPSQVRQKEVSTRRCWETRCARAGHSAGAG